MQFITAVKSYMIQGPVLFTMVNFDVAAELAAVKDAGRVAEPGAGGHGHGQGSLVGQMIHNSVLENGKDTISITL